MIRIEARKMFVCFMFSGRFQITFLGDFKLEGLQILASDFDNHWAAISNVGEYGPGYQWLFSLVW